MEVRELRYFLALAEELNFTRAAARCHVTQQALSRTIAAMERRVGTPLVERRPRVCSLTAAGTVLAERARELVAHADSVLAEVVGRAPVEPDAAGARLRMGVLVGGAGPVTVPTIQAFRAAHPGVVVSVRQLDVSEALAPLADGRVDVALVYGPQRDDERLHLTRLCSQPRVAVVSALGELAAADVLTPGDLVGRRVGARPPAAPPQWEGFFTLVPERNGEQPHRVGEPSRSIEEVLWNVSTRDLVLTAPAHLADGHRADRYGIRYIPAPDLAAVDVFVARRRSTSALPVAFEELALRMSAGVEDSAA
ncbi:MAG: LysR family transcriptional regulator [Kineosporiaceae bacterium]